MDEAESLESYLFNRHLRQEVPPDDPAPPLPPGTPTRILTEDEHALAATTRQPSSTGASGSWRRRPALTARAPAWSSLQR